MRTSVQQLSLLEHDTPFPSPPQQQPPLSGAALELAMRQVFARWRRWHPCKQFEAAVADPVTRRLLVLAADKAARRQGPSGQGNPAAD